MEIHNTVINNIPTTIWEKNKDKAYIFVHGKMGSKQDAQTFAQIADRKDFSTISFDLPEHGDRKNNKEYRCDIFMA